MAAELTSYLKSDFIGQQRPRVLKASAFKGRWLFLGDVWQCLKTVLLLQVSGICWVDVLQGIGQPTSIKNYSVHNVSRTHCENTHLFKDVHVFSCKNYKDDVMYVF